MDEITIVKIGGKIINDPELLITFLKQFSLIEGMKILVHGGGRSANKMLAKLGIPPKMIAGRRITDQVTLDVCIGQYAGNINKNIVALLQSLGVDSLGLSGADGGLIKATKRPKDPINYGYAGDIESVDHLKLKKLLNLRFVPVFCALTADENGQLLNTNADTIASSIAVALAVYGEIDLRYCFEYDGLLFDLDTKSVIDEINSENFQEYINKDILKGGVLPKVQNALTAKQNGVYSVAMCGIANLINLTNSTKII